MQLTSENKKLRYALLLAALTCVFYVFMGVVGINSKALAFNNASECTTAGGQWQQISGAPAGVMACYCSGGTVISSGSCPPTSSAGCVAAGGQWRQISGAPAGVSACYCPNNNAITSGRCPTANPNPGGGGTSHNQSTCTTAGGEWRPVSGTPASACYCPAGNAITSGNCGTTQQGTLVVADEDGQRIIDWVNAGINILAAISGLAITAGLIAAGIQYSTSGGNPQAAASAKKHISQALVALLCFVFLYSFLQWIVPGGLFG